MVYRVMMRCVCVCEQRRRRGSVLGRRSCKCRTMCVVTAASSQHALHDSACCPLQRQRDTAASHQPKPSFADDQTSGRNRRWKRILENDPALIYRVRLRT